MTLVGILILLFNIPFINVVLTSLKDDADLSAFPPPLIFKPTLEHYENIFTSPTFQFGRFLVNSLLVAIFTALITIILCLPAAYSIVRFGIGKRVIFPITTNLRTIPLIIFAVPIYIAFKTAGLIDTRTGLVFVHLLVDIPLALMLSVNFLQDVPKEIMEAARVDGASELKTLLYIVAPMMRSPIAAIFILSFIYSWNEFLFALILSIKNATTLTVGASLFITAWGVQWGNIAAAIAVSTLPPFILTFYVQRYLVEAFSGGVKE